MSETVAVNGEDKGRSSSKFVTGPRKLLTLNKSKGSFKPGPGHTKQSNWKG